MSAGGRVIYLPTAAPAPVRQPTPSPFEPLRVDEHGVLWAWCAPNGRPEQWHRAPVPPSTPTGPVGHRAPDPGRITVALDSRCLHGPCVDEALGLPGNTIVDAWEAGELVPTVEEICRLATLTGMLPQWFYRGPVPQISGPVFVCGRGPRDAEPRP